MSNPPKHEPVTGPASFDGMSTVEHVETFTVFSGAALDPVKAKEADERRQRELAWHKESVRRMVEDASGRRIVRTRRHASGACRYLGYLVRETAKFYVVDESWGGKYETEPSEKRISKDNAHVEPCTLCKDHPETRCPTG